MLLENFPVRIYHVKSNISYPTNPGFHIMHWHKELQFTFVTKGSLVVETMGNRQMIAQNQVLFINRNIPHYIIADHETEYTSLLFGIEALYTTIPAVRLQLDEFSTNGIRTISLKKDIPWQDECINKVKAVMEGKTGPLQMTALLFSILSQLMQETKQPDGHTRSIMEERTERMMRYIAAHFKEDITLLDIAGSADISKTEANRCFKAVLSTTPYQYLLETRL